MRNTLLAVVAAAGLVGCVGGIDTPNGPTDPTDPTNPTNPTNPGTGNAQSKALFDSTVYSVVSAKCIQCHSAAGPLGNITGFVATTAADGYVTAVGYTSLIGDLTPTGAPILAKIAAGHQGKTYTDDEKSKITAWLSAELTARAGGGTGTGQPAGESPADATIRLTKEWSGCMTLANFQTANMKAFGNMRAGNSACKTCHVDGEFGEIASDVDNPFFTIISTNKYYMSQYFSVDLTGGVATAKVIINTKNFTNVGSGSTPHEAHPRFTFAGSTGDTALKKFYDLTAAAKAAGTCGPPTLTN